MAVAGGFTGAEVGGADQRRENAGGEEHLLEDVVAFDVTDLVAEDELHLRRGRSEGFKDVGVNDDEVATGEAGGEGVERAAGLDHVEGGQRAGAAEFFPDAGEGGVERGELAFVDADGLGAEVGGEQAVAQPGHDREEGGVEDADHGDRDHQPEKNRDDGYKSEIGSLLGQGQP